ncbi:hypothetical protein G6F56_011462 [Rhizopus delemar]|nr:hypothetical protein G6F56_011462 [Rhizopus delemar]
MDPVYFPLIPLNVWLAILGAIICVASLIGGVGAFVKRHYITVIYMVVILVSLALQIVIGIKFYKAKANLNGYLSDLWVNASTDERASLQNEFTCCGFQTTMDKYATSDECEPLTTSLPSCAGLLMNYSKSAFSKAYLVVFAALALQVLAMANGITVLCVSCGSDEEKERRRRRESGIRLHDISAESPTTLVSSSYTELPSDLRKH